MPSTPGFPGVLLFDTNRRCGSLKIMSATRFVSVCFCLGLLLSAITGCDREEVKVQLVPKEATAPAAPAMNTAGGMESMDAHAAINAAPPSLKWVLPEGWEERPLSQMRAASFSAKGKDGQSVDVSAIPLPATGRELDLVNMWRQQMHLPTTTEAQAEQQAETIPVGTDSGKLFDIASEEPIFEGKVRGRMLVAMITRGPTSWFFKMTGDDASVAAQKSAFLQFLKSVSFDVQPATVASSDATATAANQKIWTIPSDWHEAPPSQFLFAKYLINGAAGTKAEVNVSQLEGEGGGARANVNRWRGQLGLAPITTEEEWAKQVNSLAIPGGEALVVDMTGVDAKTGNKSRLVGVIVPQNGQTWFYKLMGDEGIVGEQKETFTKFIQSAKYSNVP